MLINKITTGFVIQTFDTDTGKWISQEFVAGDQVEYEYEDMTAGPIAELTAAAYGLFDNYLPFDMEQPVETYPDCEDE